MLIERIHNDFIKLVPESDNHSLSGPHIKLPPPIIVGGFPIKHIDLPPTPHATTQQEIFESFYAITAEYAIGDLDGSEFIQESVQALINSTMLSPEAAHQTILSLQQQIIQATPHLSPRRNRILSGVIREANAAFVALTQGYEVYRPGIDMDHMGIDFIIKRNEKAFAVDIKPYENRQVSVNRYERSIIRLPALAIPRNPNIPQHANYRLYEFPYHTNKHSDLIDDVARQLDQAYEEAGVPIIKGVVRLPQSSDPSRSSHKEPYYLLHLPEEAALASQMEHME